MIFSSIRTSLVKSYSGIYNERLFSSQKNIG